jgi:hypothetical protein
MGVVEKTDIHWARSWRIIPTMYPAIRLFDGILNESEETAAREIIDATSQRAQAAGARSSKKSDQYVQAPLRYFSLQPGRFTTRHFGAYYAARTLETAVEETVFHAQQFLKRTSEPAMQLPRRVLVSSIDGSLHDLRKRKKEFRDAYDPDSYRLSQKLAVALRETGSDGVVYDSVRHLGGECAAVYNPDLLSNCREERALIYEWNGKRIEAVFELKEFLKRGAL